MADGTSPTVRTAGIITAIVAVGAAFGLEFDDAEVNATKDAAATALTGIGVLIAFGKDLINQVRTRFGR